VAEAERAFRIQTVNLNIEANNDPLGFVVAQPYLSFEDPRDLMATNRGFELQDVVAARHWSIFQKTVSKLGEVARPVSFVLFPEYFLPSSRWEDAQQIIRSDAVPYGSVVICGMDGLTRDELGSLLDRAENGPLDLPGSVRWANCASIWVKEQERVRCFVQAKIAPSKWEEARDGMLGGQEVFVFLAHQLTFAVLICFDAVSDTIPVVNNVLCALDKTTPENTAMTLDALFVIQHNPKPENQAMIDKYNSLLTSKAPRPIIQAVAAPNTGHCIGFAMYFAQSDWPETRYNPDINPPNYTLEKVEGSGLIRARFRESDPHVLTFNYIPCNWNADGPGGVHIPYHQTQCFPIKPDGSVCATGESYSQWFSGTMRASKRFPPSADPDVARRPLDLQAWFEDAFESIVLRFVGLDEERQRVICELFFSGTGKPVCPDSWDCEEEGCLCMLLRLLTKLSGTGLVDMDSTDVSTTAKLPNEMEAAILAGDENTSPAILLDEYRNKFIRGTPIVNERVVFLVRHSGNGPDGPIRESTWDLPFTRANPATDPPLTATMAVETVSGPRITQPLQRLYWYSIRSIRQCLDHATSLRDFQTSMEGVFS